MKEKANKKDAIIYIIIIVFIILLRSFIITPIRVKGQSMENTLINGELLLLDKIGYRFNDIKRFDIVVIDSKNDRLIKRVIGLPGDTIKISDGLLYINDKFVSEPYTKNITKDYSYNGKIEDNCYFVMGDNREVSLDSRYFGCFNKKDIKGKAIFRFLPFSKIGKL